MAAAGSAPALLLLLLLLLLWHASGNVVPLVHHTKLRAPEYKAPAQIPNL